MPCELDGLFPGARGLMPGFSVRAGSRAHVPSHLLVCKAGGYCHRYKAGAGQIPISFYVEEKVIPTLLLLRYKHGEGEKIFLKKHSCAMKVVVALS